MSVLYDKICQCNLSGNSMNLKEAAPLFHRFMFLGLFILCFFTEKTDAADPSFHWETLETENFKIHFHDDEKPIAIKTAVISEDIYFRLSRQFGWSPKSKIEVALIDETDLSNGSATTIPYNQVVLNIVPGLTVSSLEHTDYQLERLIIHELTHIFHLDKCGGKIPFFRSILGRHPWFFPGIYQPEWMIEGLATYFETDKTKGFGRGQGSWFDMKMRIETLKGIKSIRKINLSALDMPYLYGFYFYEFIETVYGKDKIQELVDEYSNNLLPFFINTNAKKIFNKDLTELWQEFESHLKNKYTGQLKELEQTGIAEGTELTESGDISLSDLCTLPNGNFYYIIEEPQKKRTLMRIKKGETATEVTTLSASARMDVHPGPGILLSMPELCSEHKIFNDLYLLKHGEKTPMRLTRCKRYIDAAFSHDGKTISAIQIRLGKSRLHLLDTEGNFIEEIWEGDYYENISHIDTSPVCNKAVVSFSGKDKGWNLREFDLADGSYTDLLKDTAFKTTPRYTPDGKDIVFSADYDGVFNIYRLNLADKTISKLTHVKGGAFHPVIGEKDNHLYYTGYDKKGVNIYKIPLHEPILTKPAKVPVEHATRISNTGNTTENYQFKPYSPFPTILPRFVSPFISIDNDTNSIGCFTIGTDALSMYNYALNLSYDTEFKDTSGYVSFSYSSRFNFNYSNSNKKLIFDNSKPAGNPPFYNTYQRKTDAFQASYKIPFVSLRSSKKIAVGCAAERRKYIPLDDGETIKDIQYNLLGIAFLFNNSLDFSYSISSNRGRKIKLVAENNELFDSDYQGGTYTIDYREYLPITGKHVLGFRLVHGWNTDTHSGNSLNFELGEFSDINFNSFLSEFIHEPIFNHREYNLRGYPDGLPELSGPKILLGSIEWRFPVRLIDMSFMAPPIGIRQLSGVIFLDTGSVENNINPLDKFYSSSGIELISELSLFYQIDLRFRLSFSHGFDEGGENRISMNMGSSF